MEWFWYRENDKDEIVLLRMFGDLPQVTVPARIDGRPVTEIGEYCFSEKCKYTGNEEFIKLGVQGQMEGKTKEDFFHAAEEKRVCPLAGDYITSICFPDTVKKVGDLCFYQCRKLEKIIFDAGGIEIGSDVFMNCKALKEFVFFTSSEEPTGLKQILAQRNGETTVFFTDAALLFPEYSEQYDLIGPAHIFELNIEGQGFLARQCFQDGIFEFARYDSVFLQACDTEEERVLCTMAALRLRFPKNLKKQAEDRYRTYLLSHLAVFFDEIIEKQELDLLEDFMRRGEISLAQFDACIRKATEARWILGVRTLLLWKKELSGEEEQDYGFEDF